MLTLQNTSGQPGGRPKPRRASPPFTGAAAPRSLTGRAISPVLEGPERSLFTGCFSPPGPLTAARHARARPSTSSRITAPWPWA